MRKRVSKSVTIYDVQKNAIQALKLITKLAKSKRRLKVAPDSRILLNELKNLLKELTRAPNLTYVEFESLVGKFQYFTYGLNSGVCLQLLSGKPPVEYGRIGGESEPPGTPSPKTPLQQCLEDCAKRLEDCLAIAKQQRKQNEKKDGKMKAGWDYLRDAAQCYADYFYDIGYCYGK